MVIEELLNLCYEHRVYAQYYRGRWFVAFGDWCHITRGYRELVSVRRAERASMSNRNTQFAGFAHLLMQELLEPAGYIDIGRGDTEALADYEQRIAQRAYDLVVHVLNNEKLQWYPMEEVSIEEIPDLTEFPSLDRE